MGVASVGYVFGSLRISLYTAHLGKKVGDTPDVEVKVDLVCMLFVSVPDAEDEFVEFGCSLPASGCA